MILPENDFGKQLGRLRVDGFIQEGDRKFGMLNFYQRLNLLTFQDSEILPELSLGRRCQICKSVTTTTTLKYDIFSELS